MNPSNFPQNGLPKELASIPYGEIFILTRPTGITGKTHQMIWRTLQIARHCHQEPILHTMPIENPELWECAVCRDENGMMIADGYSLLEMLCGLWGLNYDDVRSNIDFRYRPRLHPIEGEKHPIKVQPIEEGSGIFMQALPAYTRERILGDFKGIWQDNFNHSVGVTIEDLADIIKEVENSRRKYKLKFKIKKKKVQQDDEVIVKLDSCDIILTDNNGQEYPLGHWVPQVTALYLTFILFKDGIKCEELFYNEEFYNTFIKILHQFPYGSRTPSMGTLFQNAKSKLSVIRGAILAATDDNYAKEQFAIDGYSQEIYRVVGATDADRTLIKKTFGIE